MQSWAETLNEFSVTVSEKHRPLKTQVSFSSVAWVYVPSKAKKSVALQAEMLNGVVDVNAVEVWAETVLPAGQVALIRAKQANTSIRLRLEDLIVTGLPYIMVPCLGLIVAVQPMLAALCIKIKGKLKKERG